ncbi:MerR family transcriptional regulator [Altererythrobacter sp. B11]|uniref:MerR family transcriptional regulator n=1 Tax=Altererythrobacter sp. B11 TaxID=2060312 RepID=UPI000E5B9FB8|nr:helix-turn-helix domain-containing protein [Altererythrobacter sp. B11]
MRIGELACRTGVRVETIRWYEKAGLLEEPDRSASNYREYDKASLNRLTFIKRGRDLGFSLDQVSQLMNLTRNPGENCATVDAIAVQHLAAIDRKIADLTALRRELTDLVESCAGGSIGDCDILRALSPGSDHE